MNWARLLKRVFHIDIESCQQCQGKVRIIASIEEPPVITKILDHLGLASTPPRIFGPRGPPPSPLEEFAQDPSTGSESSQDIHFT